MEYSISWDKIKRISVVSRWHSYSDNAKYYVQIEYKERPTLSVVYDDYKKAMIYADYIIGIAHKSSGF